MQNKGFVRVFAILLVLVCSYYLSFSFVTRHYAKQAAVYANGNLDEEVRYLDSLSTEKVWLGYTLKECREKEINLGLDLKGGMNVILEINVADVLRSLSDNNPDPNFNAALDKARERQKTSAQKDYISLFVEEFRKLDPGVRLSAIFSTSGLREKISPQSTDEQVMSVLRSELKSAVDNSFNVLRTRIDRFGVVAPNIQKLDTDGRILVELPGIKEPARVRKLLQGSANLEFWETYDFTEIYQNISAINTLLGTLQVEDVKNEINKSDSVQVAEANKDTTKTKVSEADKLLAEISQTKDSLTTPQSEGEWKKRNPLFAILQRNVTRDGLVVPGPAIGRVNRTDTATVNKYLAMRQVKDLLPQNLVFKWTVKPVDEKEQYYELVALKTTTRNGKAPLEGDVIVDAVADATPNSPYYQVSMKMNQEGSKKWARLTKENIKKCIAIVLDNYVYSFPRVQNEITGGQSSITGNFTPSDAKDLANVLKSGKMPATVHIIQEDVIGPSLGQEAINEGMLSFILAIVILMIYMCVIYGFIPGMVANIAMLLNLFFTLGVLAAFGAALTLSGIAGLVLSLALAVDANVLIYERAKEELRGGKNLKKSVEDGYKNAFSAIFDANLTSLITAIILFFFGTGPIRGFATTLMIGIIASFFTAVFLTHLVYDTVLEKGKWQHLTFTTKLSKNFLIHPKINFIGQRKSFYIGIVAFAIIGAVAYFTIGLNNGIDFTGGRNYVVRFDQPVQTQEIESMLDPYLDNTVSVITIGSSNQVRITTNYKIQENAPEVDLEIEQKLLEGLKPLLKEGIDHDAFIQKYVQSSQKVGPSIADDIKTGAIWAVVISMICMALYILLRFRDVAFSVGTLVSVIHDGIFIIFCYALLWKVMPFSMEIDQTFIAAILTVVGFSMNDTVVVFDRVRETLRNYPKRNRFRIFNDALNSTLSRTFNTSFSTLVVLLCIFLLGGSTIRSFTFAMLLGVIVGTFSTLYIAAPIAYDIIKRERKKKGIIENESMTEE